MSLKMTPGFQQAAFLAQAPQTVYALLDFQPDGVGGRLPLDLRIVLDHSGSMADPAGQGQRQSKLETLKACAVAMIGRLEIGDRLAVIAFDHAAETVFEGVLRTPHDRQKAEKAIRQLRPDGGTSILGGLKEALAEPPLPDRVARLVLVTDGEGLQAEDDDCRALAFDGRGLITWLVYGTGVAYNDRFLDSLAQANGGSYAHLSDWQAAADAFAAEVAVMGEVAIRNLVVSIEPAPGIAIVRADRVVPQLLPLPAQAPEFLSVDLGDVDRARGQKLLIQLAVPALPEGPQALARVRCAFHVPVRKLLNQTLELDLSAPFTRDERALRPDGDVLRTAQLAGANRLTTLGMAEAAGGQADKGGLTLASAAGLYEQLGLAEMGAKLKTLASTLTTQGRLDSQAEDAKRTLTTMARQAWQLGDDGDA
jgi:Ca-activated chloride channel family protein